MIAQGKTLANGNHANLNWICSPAETAPINPYYGLITAASSLHWMDWDVLLPQLATALAPGAFLAIFDDNLVPGEWNRHINRLIPQYSTNRDFTPYNLIEELNSRRLFALVGQQETQPKPYSQSIDENIEAMHSRNGFSRDRMTPAAAKEFDAKMRQILLNHFPDGFVHLQVKTTVCWGRPLTARASA
jgi:hypothetical protein